MAKNDKNTAHKSNSDKSEKPETVKGPSGRVYGKSARGNFGKLDGFFDIGTREEPKTGTIEARFCDAVEKDTGKIDKKTKQPIVNRFLVFEVENVDGEIMLSQLEDGENVSVNPEAWPGLRVGMSVAANLEFLAANPDQYRGQMMLVEVGGTEHNPKTGFDYRVIDVRPEEPSARANGAPARA